MTKPPKRRARSKTGNAPKPLSVPMKASNGDHGSSGELKVDPAGQKRARRIWIGY